MRRSEGIGMKRVVLASLIVLSLAACRREPEQSAVEPVNAADEAANAAGDLPEPDINASLEKIGAMHPDEADYRFAGRWAADERLCENEAAWRFTNSELRTPGGSVCRFTDVREVAGGYDIAARCTAEGDERDERLRIRFAESAGGGMLFESETMSDSGLIRCGE